MNHDRSRVSGGDIFDEAAGEAGAVELGEAINLEAKDEVLCRERRAVLPIQVRPQAPARLHAAVWLNGPAF